jgi:hypothetical protein
MEKKKALATLLVMFVISALLQLHYTSKGRRKRVCHWMDV